MGARGEWWTIFNDMEIILWSFCGSRILVVWDPSWLDLLVILLKGGNFSWLVLNKLKWPWPNLSKKGPTEWTPKKIWVSNSSIYSNLPIGVYWQRSHSIFAGNLGFVFFFNYLFWFQLRLNIWGGEELRFKYLQLKNGRFTCLCASKTMSMCILRLFSSKVIVYKY